MEAPKSIKEFGASIFSVPLKKVPLSQGALIQQ